MHQKPWTARQKCHAYGNKVRYETAYSCCFACCWQIAERPLIRYGTTGWPVHGYQVELRDKDGQPVPVGEAGDLYVKGPSAALIYWANQIKSQKKIYGSWLKTGDTYIENEDSTFTYSGRSDDMIKVSGIYVSPFEVEATLIEHPAVLKSADESELKAFVKERLVPYKHPRTIEFIDELPKTATGKIQSFKLRG